MRPGCGWPSSGAIQGVGDTRGTNCIWRTVAFGSWKRPSPKRIPAFQLPAVRVETATARSTTSRITRQQPHRLLSHSTTGTCANVPDSRLRCGGPEKAYRLVEFLGFRQV